jgi:hypothetical protein
MQPIIENMGVFHESNRQWRKKSAELSKKKGYRCYQLQQLGRPKAIQLKLLKVKVQHSAVEAHHAG